MKTKSPCTIRRSLRVIGSADPSGRRCRVTPSPDGACPPKNDFDRTLDILYSPYRQRMEAPRCLSCGGPQLEQGTKGRGNRNGFTEDGIRWHGTSGGAGCINLLTYFDDDDAVKTTHDAPSSTLMEKDEVDLAISLEEDERLTPEERLAKRHANDPDGKYAVVNGKLLCPMRPHDFRIFLYEQK